MRQDKIPRRILGTLFSSLSAGVVPRVGAPYIAIGRNREIMSLTDDLDRVAEGEGVTRFIIGRYGSGKSFLIQLARGYAIDRGFVTADCDLTPERRLSGSGGTGLSTYRELIKNLSCKAAPDGGAIPVIIGKWHAQISSSLIASGISPEDPRFSDLVSDRIVSESRTFEGAVGGFDFAVVVSKYCRAWGNGDDALMSSCLKWLRGEFNTKTEAREAIGIRSLSVIDDQNWYDHLKLLAALVRKIGYSGLCVFIDEGVNLYKISNRISRESNYEKILSMFNDTMQGKAEGLMIVFGGTPKFLEDERRGLFSYEALRSRLADSRFIPDGTGLSTGPIIRLRRLSDSELLALIMRLTSLYGAYYGTEPDVSDEEKKDFLSLMTSRAGASEMITPREVIRDYIALLDILRSDPSKKFADIVSNRAPDDSKTVKPDERRTIKLDDIEF